MTMTAKKCRATFAARLQARWTLSANSSSYTRAALGLHALLEGADRTFTIAQSGADVKRNAPWTACDLSPPSLKRLVAQSLCRARTVATALCVTSPAGHGWNKFQHSTALSRKGGSR